MKKGSWNWRYDPSRRRQAIQSCRCAPYSPGRERFASRNHALRCTFEWVVIFVIYFRAKCSLQILSIHSYEQITQQNSELKISCYHTEDLQRFQPLLKAGPHAAVQHASPESSPPRPTRTPGPPPGRSTSEGTIHPRTRPRLPPKSCGDGSLDFGF